MMSVFGWQRTQHLLSGLRDYHATWNLAAGTVLTQVNAYCCGAVTASHVCRVCSKGLCCCPLLQPQSGKLGLLLSKMSPVWPHFQVKTPESGAHPVTMPKAPLLLSSFVALQGCCMVSLGRGLAGQITP